MKFGPDRRVRKHPEFQAIQRVGCRISTKNFVIIVALADDSLTPARLGITASRRTGNSVRRSRLKRIVRAAFRASGGLVPPGFDVVIICKTHEPEMTSDTVVQEWRAVSKKIRKATDQLATTAEPARSSGAPE